MNTHIHVVFIQFVYEDCTILDKLEDGTYEYIECCNVVWSFSRRPVYEKD
jgi:hypothetical protein